MLDTLPSVERRETSPVSSPVEVFRQAYRLSLSSTLACAQKHPALEESLHIIEQMNAVNGMYQTRHADRLHEEMRLPFRISAEAFALPESVYNRLPEYGKALVAYYHACNDLYDELPEDHRWRTYLDHHKPAHLKGHKRGKHLFIRPDFILTDDEPVVTEIETSPFGLALAHYLNDAYPDRTLDNAPALMEEFRNLGSVCFGYTPYTARYNGQFAYLARKLQKQGIDATTSPMQNVEMNGRIRATGREMQTLYRCFYLHEATPSMLHGNVIPNGNAQMEEKAVMAMLWDEELEPTLRARLGDAYDTLKRIIPPTFVVKGNVPRNFPFPLKRWEDLATLTRKQRAFVLKTSGFSSASSWGKGITFLEKLSQEDVRSTMNAAAESMTDLFVIQQFRKGAKFTQSYFDFHGAEMREMHGRVRFTPYFSTSSGTLLTSKATMCENTDLIHGSVDSINSPVSYAGSPL